MSRAWACCIVLFFAEIAPAQGPDGLANIAAKSADAEVRLAIKEAERLAAREPAQAIDRFKVIQSRLNSDVVLPADRRQQLQRIVNDRLRVLAAGPIAETPPPKLSPEAERKAEEFARLKAGFKAEEQLRKSGQRAQADEQFAALKPSLAEMLLARSDSEIRQVSNRQVESAQVRQDKERTWMTEFAGVERRSAGISGDVEFPKDFRERVAKRRSDTAPTADELRILRSLETLVDVKFKDTRLEDAMDYLSTLIGLPIVIDKGALDELRINYDTPVTFSVRRPVSARSALRAILRNVGLTFVVSDGVVFATTQERAKAYLVVKTYTVADLVIPINLFDIRGEWFNAMMLIDMIMSTVDPDSWETRGGPGVIRFYQPTHSIVVRQSAEVQTMIKRSMAK